MARERDHRTSVQVQRQEAQSDVAFSHGSRSHVTSTDPLVQYLVRWRLQEAFRRLTDATGTLITHDSPILVMCAGEGFDGTILCDLGYTNVTISDISTVAVEEAVQRDGRLKGMRLNAVDADISDDAFAVTVVQDGLHHLPSPVGGFTEMLRIAATAAVFLEPHDSLAGRALGQTWERNGDAVNYVFRWNTKLVEDVSSSLLGPDSFHNLSFSFWHHNIRLERLGRKLGGGSRGTRGVRALKRVADVSLGRFGNQFCGLVVKR